MRPRVLSAVTVLALSGLLLISPQGTEQAFAQATSFDIYGFRANEGGGGALSVLWTKGNLGNTWAEGEWVPYKLTITNVQTDFPNLTGFPNNEIEVSFDFTSKGNRFVDLVRGLQVSQTDLADAQGWVQGGGSAFPMTTRGEVEVAQNGQMENTWTGFTLLRTGSATFGANLESLVNRDLDGNDGTPADERHTFIVPIQALLEAGIPATADTIVIYWQLHESRSFVWANSLQEQYDAPPADNWGGYLYSLAPYAADVRPGAGFVPGSSGHIHLEEVSGSKDVPIPIPERLPGSVSGLKWHDFDANGLINGPDTNLAGWPVYVSGTLEQIVFTTSTVTDALGFYSFPNLTSNVDWRIREASQLPGESGWSQTYPLEGTTVGVGVGTDFVTNGDTAAIGWTVSLTLNNDDQPDMNFGNRQCEVVIQCPPDDTVECNTSADPSVTGYPILVEGNCGPLDTSYSDDTFQGVCGTDGFTQQIERTWVVTDSEGNADTCVQVITEIDTTPPILPSPPPDLTLECDADLSPPNLAPPTDNCDPDPIISVRQDTIPGDCPQSFTIVNTWIALDVCGNSDSIKQTITVVDSTPPELAGVPDGATYECIAPAPPTVTATDNCDPDVPVLFTADTANACPATVTRVWTATDDCGNSVADTQVVMIVDTTPPVLVGAPDDASQECSDAYPDTATVTATDNCDPNPSVVFGESITPGDCADAYTIRRVWTATDSCGNQDSAVQVITVQDNTAPEIACPGDLRFECDDIGDFGWPTAADNCDPDPAITMIDRDSTAGDCGQAYTLVFTYEALDRCGNADTCMQTVTVEDTTPPEIVCPDDLNFECDAVGDFGWPTATDNCTNEPAITLVDRDSTAGGCPQEYVLVLTYEAMDDCGNADTCAQTITVEDNTPPEIACPNDINANCDDIPGFGTATATDNCDPEPVVRYEDDTLTTTCPLEIARTWIAEDACGNADTCIQSIIVDDTTPPEIACPANKRFECDAVGDFGWPTATDNCTSEPAITMIDRDSTAGDCAAAYTLVLTYEAVDACGNADTCAQTITVEDTTPPEIACPDDLRFECDDIGDFGWPTATDNCDPDPAITMIGRDSTAGDCAAAYTLVFTYEAADACGNADTCAQTITVEDTTPPEIACPSDRTFNCDNVGGFGTPTATDNCDPDPTITMIDRDSTATCPQGYVLVLSYEAVDACGNADTCAQTITVEDRVAPWLTCAADDTVDCEQLVIFTPPSVSDNCDPAPAVSVVSTDTIPGPALGEFTHTRTWVATDACGNVSFPCSQSIIVLPCSDSGCTFTQGGWGSKCPPGHQGDPLSTQPGCIRDNYFDQVFPGGVTIGDPSGYTATWTSAAAVREYLPAGGTPRPLSQDYSNPMSTSAGVLGGQILALTLNVGYSCAGVFSTLDIADPGFCYGSYTIPEFCGKFAGITVDSFLVLANLVLSGDNGAVDGYGAQWSDINYTATCLNELLNDCDPTAPSVSLTDLASAGLILGDVNYDGNVSTGDMIYLANFVLSSGAAPIPVVEVGDVDWNGSVDQRDIIFLVDWLLNQPILTREMDADPPAER